MKKIFIAIQQRIFLYRLKFKLKSLLNKGLLDFFTRDFKLVKSKMDTIDNPSLINLLFSQMNINFFIQLGVGNPEVAVVGKLKKYTDPFYNLLKDKRGIVVEANPDYFKKLENYYKNQKLYNCLIDNVSDVKKKLYFVNNLENYRDFAHGICSSSRQHLINHGILPKDISSVEVKTKRLTDILNENKISKLDLIILDLEGMEYKILLDFFSSFNFNPNIIFEYKHMNIKFLNELIGIMEKRGYKFLFFKNDLFCFNNNKIEKT